MPGIPLGSICRHSPSTDPRRRGVCVKCGRKLIPISHLTVGEGIELLNLLYRNPKLWNRKLREELTHCLGEQNISP